MKKRLKLLTWIFSALLLMGAPCLTFADDATQIDVQISYACSDAQDPVIQDRQ